MDTEKEFYIVWLDEKDVPQGIITGPFATVEHGQLCADALVPLFVKDHRLCVVGGNLYTSWSKHVRV